MLRNESDSRERRVGRQPRSRSGILPNISLATRVGTEIRACRIVSGNVSFHRMVAILARLRRVDGTDATIMPVSGSSKPAQVDGRLGVAIANV